MAALDDVLPVLKAQAESILCHFRGQPNRLLSSRRELRWGRKGSLVLSLDGQHSGRWADFETGTSGDAIDFVQQETGADFAGALEWFGSKNGTVSYSSAPARPEPDINDDAEKERKVAAAAQIARRSVPIADTPAERYLISRLGGPVPADAVAAGNLRFHRAPLFGSERIAGSIGALVAVMRDPMTGEGVGIQRTFLDAAGAKIERRMLGRAGAVFLYPFEDVEAGLGLCEGVETGLAVQARFGWRAVWCAMSAGGLASFPVLSGVEALTIFADHDQAGQRGAGTCAARWTDVGAEVSTVMPPDAGADFNDRGAV